VIENGIYCEEFDVRWGELDAMNHVNNVVYFRYLETTRINWFKSQELMMKSADTSPVLAAVSCNFRKPIHYPAKIRVTLKAHRASARRLVLDSTIVDARNPDHVYADSEATLVWFKVSPGPGQGRAVELPPQIDDAIAAISG
jgi:acyl-CoA thioester hydrolase